MTHASFRSSKLIQPIYALLILSLAINVFLARRVQLLERRIGFVLSANDIKVGEPVSPIDLIDMEGKTTCLTYNAGDVPTLIYVMSPQCVWCQSNNLNMNALVNQAGPGYRIFVVSLVKEGADEYRRKHGVKAPIWFLPAEAQRVLAVSGTPTTLLISDEGKMVAKWVGAFRKRDVADIEQRLDVTLSGPAVDGDGRPVTVAPRLVS